MRTPPPQGDKTRFQARLERVRALTDNTQHLEWEITGPHPFHFQAGQFISLHLDRNGADDLRAYSIACASHPDRRIHLCLNRVPGGYFSNNLCDLKPGAGIEFEGPFGFFTLRELIRDSVFVATGTGIAPIRGILQEIWTPGKPAGQKAWLIFGVRYPETLLYREEFDALAERQANFEFWPTLSRPPADWPGRRGHVQEHVEALVREHPQADVYLCGLKAMVDDLRTRLKALGLDRKQIRYEKYD